jgi:hypothetical protein
MFTEKEASQYLKCSIGLLRKWRQLGEGPAYAKMGRLIRYAEGDLAAFVAAHRVQPPGGLC